MEKYIDMLIGIPIETIFQYLLLFFIFCFVYYIIRKLNQLTYRLRRIAPTKILKLIFDGISKTTTESPKSISGGDSVYLPLILKDFPSFDVQFAKNKIKQCVQDVFLGVSTKDTSALAKYDKAVMDCCRTVESTHRNLSNSNLKIHNIAISDYIKARNTATVKFQITFQFESNSDASGLIQSKYEFDYSYMMNNVGNEVICARCPHCSAPIEDTKTEKCNYCGNVLIEILDRVWTISAIKIF